MRSRRDVFRDVGLVLAGAVMMDLAAPPTDAWPFGLVAWVPLALIAGSRTPLRAGLIGWLQGTLAQGIALASVGGALRDTAGVSPAVAALGVCVVAAYEGARFACVAAGVAWMRGKGWPGMVAFPVALAVSERVYPMLFPWSTALLFHGIPTLLQAADLGGTIAITLWVGLASSAIATAWLRRANLRVALTYGIAVPAATVAVVIAYGSFRIGALSKVTESAPTLTLGLVQGDIEHEDENVVDPLPIYRNASREIARTANVDLLVWPEAAAGRVVRDELLPTFLSNQIFARTADGSFTEAPVSVALLTGLVLERSGENPHLRNEGSKPANRDYNAAVLAAPPGRVLGSYDKRSLVVLGEYLPFEQELPWLRTHLPWAGTFSAGSRADVLLLGDKRILTLICFEDILADAVRSDVAELHPDLLVNVTSDAWFGVSRLAELHFAIAQLRAVEHRRFLVHATNTGVTAVMDATGRVVMRLPAHERTTAIVSVRCLRDGTVYDSIGGWLKALVVVGALAMAALRRPGSVVDRPAVARRGADS